MELLEDVFLYIPIHKWIIRISEGTGNNLWTEDLEQGYVDYLSYSVFSLLDNLEEVDGGEILLKEFLQKKYESLIKTVPDVLEFVFGGPNITYQILQ